MDALRAFVNEPFYEYFYEKRKKRFFFPALSINIYIYIYIYISRDLMWENMGFCHMTLSLTRNLLT